MRRDTWRKVAITRAFSLRGLMNVGFDYTPEDAEYFVARNLIGFQSKLTAMMSLVDGQLPPNTAFVGSGVQIDYSMSILGQTVLRRNRTF